MGTPAEAVEVKVGAVEAAAVEAAVETAVAEERQGQ